MLESVEADAIIAQYLDELPDNYIGRYSELADASTIGTLLKAAELGLNDKSAAEAAGIHPLTLGRWFRRADEEPNGAFARFVAALKRARAAGKLTLLNRIKTASEKPQHWTAAAWTLERTDPEQFALRKDNSDGPKVVVQIGAGVTDVQVTVVTPEAAGQLAQVLDPTPLSPLPLALPGETIENR